MNNFKFQFWELVIYFIKNIPINFHDNLIMLSDRNSMLKQLVDR